MRKLLLVCAVGLTTISASPPANAGGHPSLVFGKDELPAIQARLSGVLAPIADGISAGVEYPFEGGNYPMTPDPGYEYFDDRRAIADTLGSYAFAAVAFRGQSPVGDHAMQLAKAYLDGICSYDDWVFAASQDGPAPDLNSGHFLMNVALAYDWLYDDIGQSTRDKCRARVEAEGKKMYDASLGSGWWHEEYLQNHHWINNAGLGMAALAFEDEIPDAKLWLEQVRSELEKAHSVLDIIQGGAWHEGIGYLDYGLSSLIPFALADRRLHQRPDLADVQILRDYPTLRRYAMPPALERRREYPVWGDYSGSNNDGTLAYLAWAMREKKDALAAWYAGQFIEGKTQGKGGFTSWPPSHRSMILAAILWDDSVAPAEPPAKGAAWALDYYASDLSLGVARSGWDDGGALFAVKSGVYGGHANFERLKTGGAPGGSLDFGHDHADDMTLFFFAEGEWLTSTVPAYYIGRDEGPGVLQGNRTKYANSLLVDGVGQLGEGARHCDLSSCSWFWDRVSSLPIQGSTASYAYFLGAGSKLYDSALGLQSFGRSVFFVDRRYPVVRDVVRASAAHRFDIVYHAMDDVTREGDWLRLAAKNDKALGVRVVSPPAFALDTEAQTAVHLDKFDDDGSMTAAYVHPESDTDAVTFLTVLVPSNAANWDSRAKVEPIDAAVPERGARIDDGESVHRVVMADEPSASASAAGIDVTGLAGTVKEAGGKTERVALAGGSKLAADGKAWIEVVKGAPATLEVEPSADGAAISGEFEEVLVYAPAAKSVTLNGASVAFSQEGERVRVKWSASANGTGGSGGTTGAGGSISKGSGGVSASPKGGTFGDDSGCACHASRAPASGSRWLLLGLGLLALRRRRAHLASFQM